MLDKKRLIFHSSPTPKFIFVRASTNNYSFKLNLAFQNEQICMTTVALKAFHLRAR
uniref:Uncharacterized protein n=1 Tax=Anguilla anguilla TaxID=7936 RepID=A0A0E9SHZ2_ANGAN